jgi:hypothetical protein
LYAVGTERPESTIFGCGNLRITERPDEKK